jgi:hypothetical protein
MALLTVIGRKHAVVVIKLTKNLLFVINGKHPTFIKRRNPDERVSTGEPQPDNLKLGKLRLELDNLI